MRCYAIITYRATHKGRDLNYDLKLAKKEIVEGITKNVKKDQVNSVQSSLKSHFLWEISKKGFYVKAVQLLPLSS